VHERRATIPHFFRRIDVNKMIAIVFGNEKAAYEGVQALSALDREGSIDVNSLQKKADQEKGDAKAAIEARISRLRDDYQRRQQPLVAR